MSSICFFNNKGGVGKTTLLCNVASYLSSKMNKKVLLIDADPQCNATQLILGDEECEKLYRSTRKHNQTTLYDILKPIALGDATISHEINPHQALHNHFAIDIVAGHPRLALMEDRLSQAWLDLSGGDIGGIRKTNWNTQLVNIVTQNYDYVFFDVGPSLGALNRSVLLGVDYFITPMACDIFSLVGIANIGDWLRDWITSYQNGLSNAERLGFKNVISEFPIQQDPHSVARFAGFTVQQYITKSAKGVRRATKSYEVILDQIPDTINNNLAQFFPKGLSSSNMRLPDVPHMYSLVPLAQSANAPIHQLGVAAGQLAGTQYNQRSEYTNFISEVTSAIARNIG
jgi:cellulose biosynthesis protein BcsQ